MRPVIININAVSHALCLEAMQDIMNWLFEKKQRRVVSKHCNSHYRPVYKRSPHSVNSV